ncbi:MAG: hypothetical protein LC775_13310 [Acidobacteria bacterium]|nr:hypothetical protein [Acidobacteriota bacterium]
MAAVQTAEANSAKGVSEAHLLYSALNRSQSLVALLTGLGVPITVVRDHFQAYLRADSAPGIDVVDLPDGGREVYRYGMLDLIEGRASGLAAAPESHALDAIDIFVAALFDPKSMTTYATAVMAGVDRSDLLDQMSNQLRRYRGVVFPPTRVVRLEPPGRVAWSKRQDVVEFLKATVGRDVYWTYRKSEDDLLIYSESAAVLGSIIARGF